MTLLSLERVGKRYGDGRRQTIVLREASLELDSGELGMVWGPRRSGRSTLLRLASGIEPPDSGRVCFDGRDLAETRHKLLGEGIGYAQSTVSFDGGLTAVELVTMSLLARGVAQSEARSRAHAALERTGAHPCAAMTPRELDGGEAVRLELARALALGPRLIVIDEPIKGVDLLERDEILLLLRSLADEGTAILASTGESTALSGADRTFTLGDGELRGNARSSPELAEVLPLRRAAGPG